MQPGSRYMPSIAAEALIESHALAQSPQVCAAMHISTVCVCVWRCIARSIGAMNLRNLEIDGGRNYDSPEPNKPREHIYSTPCMCTPEQPKTLDPNP